MATARDCPTKMALKKRKWAFRFLLGLLGIMCATVGVKSFLLPNHFLDGGVTGVSILAHLTTGASLPVLIVIINLPFLVLGYKHLGIWFAVRSIVSIGLFALALAFWDIPPLTDVPLLTAIFGGLLVGAGIGLSMRAGSVLDGTEVMAIVLNRSTGVSIGTIILITNIIIFSVAIYVLKLEIAMYSIITYAAASKAIDFILHGIEEYMGIIIISKENHEIRRYLQEDLGRGVTFLQGRGGMSDNGFDIIFCVVTRPQIQAIRTQVDEIDASAFLVTFAIDDASGGILKRRPFSKHTNITVKN